MLSVDEETTMPRTRTSAQKIEWLVRENTRCAKFLWSGELDRSNLCALRKITHESGLAVAAREILWMNGGWYVTAGGLLRVAKENHCHGIPTHAVTNLSDATN